MTKLIEKLLMIGLATVFMLISNSVSASLKITHVSVDRTLFATDHEKTIRIHFHINEPAQVMLELFDSSDNLVRAIESNGLMQVGDNQLIWDGRDLKGSLVASEAYAYTLTAKTSTGNIVSYDLTDKTGGKTLAVEDLKYSIDDEMVAYVLPQAARVFVRIGIEDGPVLRTLVSNAARSAGHNEEYWDGWDQSHVALLKKHPKLQLGAEAFSLSRNVIIVKNGDSSDAVAYRNNLHANDGVKRKQIARGKMLNRHAYHSMDVCRDVNIKLVLPENITRNKEGLPVISGATPFRLEVEKSDDVVLNAQRFEVVYFLNNIMLYENEVAYTPYTWTWNPKKTIGGTHYMTALVVASGGHYGVATVKFSIAKTNSSKGSDS